MEIVFHILLYPRFVKVGKMRANFGPSSDCVLVGIHRIAFDIWRQNTNPPNLNFAQ